MGDADLMAHILAPPTKADPELFANRVEKAFRQDIEALQADKAHIGGRREDLEAQWEVVTPALQALHERCKTQDRRFNSLIDQMDDFEDRSRRVNIRIRGMPEATGPRDIVPSLQGLLKQVFGRNAPDHIAIDRAHRDFRPPSDDPDKPWDIFCKLHKYFLKESIMFHGPSPPSPGCCIENILYCCCGSYVCFLSPQHSLTHKSNTCRSLLPPDRGLLYDLITLWLP
ncbi:hypothetical protein AB205_0102580 [Aquarana catesbeiana]|uniref:Uncharacterized protein n=1 Tax=Aquarana catesbeiana TaxID=8400 RepID=A0A2G9SJV8_AQUCT|nr:hypothetical protein AB205_0102580 [Aquarana catesbeiana]